MRMRTGKLSRGDARQSWLAIQVDSWTHGPIGGTEMRQAISGRHHRSESLRPNSAFVVHVLRAQIWQDDSAECYKNTIPGSPVRSKYVFRET